MNQEVIEKELEEKKNRQRLEEETRKKREEERIRLEEKSKKESQRIAVDRTFSEKEKRPEIVDVNERSQGKSKGIIRELEIPVEKPGKDKAVPSKGHESAQKRRERRSKKDYWEEEEYSRIKRLRTGKHPARRNKNNLQKYRKEKKLS